MKFCTNCGKQLEDFVVFCYECGTRAPESKPAAPKPQASTPRYCVNCGWKMEPGKEFCTNCGTRLTAKTVVSDTMADESIWVAHAQQAMAQKPVPAQNDPSTPQQPRPNKKSPFDEPLLPVVPMEEEVTVQAIPPVPTYPETPKAPEIPAVSVPVPPVVEVPPVYPVTEKPPRKKAKLLWLWILLGILGAIAVAAVILWNTFSGWIHLGGEYRYLDRGHFLKGLQAVDDCQYFFDQDGIMQTQWQEIDDEMYYFGEDGVMCVGFQTIDGDVYCFDGDGIMLKGLLRVDGQQYYFGKDGTVQTDWQIIGGKRYYFNEEGIMQTGLVTVEGVPYYMNKVGHVLTGWFDYDGNRYYGQKDQNGALCTGKWQIDGDYYYFDTTGKMATGQVGMAAGDIFYFDEEGSFQYREKTVTDVATNSSSDTKTFSNRAGGESWGYYKILQEPLTTCLSFTVDLAIMEVNVGNCDGTWQLHVRTTNGTWKHVGYFEVSNREGTITVNLSSPLNIDAFLCTRYDSSKWSGSMAQSMVEATYRTTYFGDVSGVIE